MQLAPQIKAHRSRIGIMALAQPYIGVDIAKDWIDVFDPKTATA